MSLRGFIEVHGIMLGLHPTIVLFQSQEGFTGAFRMS